MSIFGKLLGRQESPGPQETPQQVKPEQPLEHSEEVKPVVEEINRKTEESEALSRGLGRLAMENPGMIGQQARQEIYAPIEIGRDELGQEDAAVFQPSGAGKVRKMLLKFMGGGSYGLKGERGLVDTRKLKPEVKEEMDKTSGRRLSQAELKEMAGKFGLTIAREDADKYTKKYQEGRKAEGKVYVKEKTKQEIEQAAGEVLFKELARLEDKDGGDLKLEKQNLEQFEKDMANAKDVLEPSDLAGLEEEAEEKRGLKTESQKKLNDNLDIMRQPLLDKQKLLDGALAEFSSLSEKVKGKEDGYRKEIKDLQEKMRKINQTQVIKESRVVQERMAQWQEQEKTAKDRMEDFRKRKEEFNLRLNQLKSSKAEVDRVLARINKIGKTSAELRAEREAEKEKEKAEKEAARAEKEKKEAPKAGVEEKSGGAPERPSRVHKDMSAEEIERLKKSGGKINIEWAETEAAESEVTDKKEGKPADTAAGKSKTEVEVPLMMTRDMRQQLADRGMSKEDINKLKPEDAWKIIRGEKLKVEEKFEAEAETETEADTDIDEELAEAEAKRQEAIARKTARVDEAREEAKQARQKGEKLSKTRPKGGASTIQTVRTEQQPEQQETKPELGEIAMGAKQWLGLLFPDGYNQGVAEKYFKPGDEKKYSGEASLDLGQAKRAYINYHHEGFHVPIARAIEMAEGAFQQERVLKVLKDLGQETDAGPGREKEADWITQIKSAMNKWLERKGKFKRSPSLEAIKPTTGAAATVTREKKETEIVRPVRFWLNAIYGERLFPEEEKIMMKHFKIEDIEKISGEMTAEQAQKAYGGYLIDSIRLKKTKPRNAREQADRAIDVWEQANRKIRHIINNIDKYDQAEAASQQQVAASAEKPSGTEGAKKKLAEAEVASGEGGKVTIEPGVVKAVLARITEEERASQTAEPVTPAPAPEPSPGKEKPASGGKKKERIKSEDRSGAARKLREQELEDAARKEEQRGREPIVLKSKIGGPDTETVIQSGPINVLGEAFKKAEGRASVTAEQSTQTEGAPMNPEATAQRAGGTEPGQVELSQVVQEKNVMKWSKKYGLSKVAREEVAAKLGIDLKAKEIKIPQFKFVYAYAEYLVESGGQKNINEALKTIAKEEASRQEE